MLANFEIMCKKAKKDEEGRSDNTDYGLLSARYLRSV